MIRITTGEGCKFTEMQIFPHETKFPIGSKSLWLRCKYGKFESYNRLLFEELFDKIKNQDEGRWPNQIRRLCKSQIVSHYQIHLYPSLLLRNGPNVCTFDLMISSHLDFLQKRAVSKCAF